MSKPTTEAGEPVDLKGAVSTSHLLHRAQQLASDRFALLMGDKDLTLRQFVVMAAVAARPGLAQVELVRDTGIDRSTLADMMNRLERRGWIERRASELDGRAHAVFMSNAGLETLADARCHAMAADAAILDPLPRTKAKALTAILTKLAQHADKEARRLEREAKRQAKLKARERKKSRAALKIAICR